MPKPSDNNKKRKKAREVEELLLQLGIKNSSNEPSTGTRLPQGIKELLSKLSTQRLDQLEYAKLEELALQIRRFMQWRDDSASLSSRADSREDGEPDEALLRATRSLHRAAESGDLESCQMALRRVPSVDCQDAYGLTALHCAARNGQSEIASRLLSEGASINAQDQDGNTPLMLATVNQQPHLLRLLTDRGADLVVKNRQGFTAADLAFAAHDLQSLAILEEKQLALQFDAAVHNETIPELVRSHATECVRYWLENYPKRDAEKPCDLQYKDEQTIAHVASQIGSTEFLHLVAEQDGNFDKIDNTNSSPLFYAAQQGSEEIAELLLSKGCNINRVCNLGRTPLFSAVMNSHIEFVKMLLRAGANVHLKDGMGKCPLAYCIESENQEIFDCVLDAMKSTDQFECETQSNLIQLAAELSRVQMLKQLHQASMPLDIPRAKDGRTAVMAACHAGTAETVAYLAENNCDVNRIDRAGNTPALLAAANGQLSVLNVLKSHQANFDVPNSEGKTAILVAAGSKDNALETVKFLLDQGCKINVIDNKGNTVASQATSALNWPLIKLLIEKKVPMDIADNKGNTPLMKAITAQSEDGSLTRKIVIALIGYGCSSTVKNNKGNSALSMAAKMGRVDLLTHFAASGKPIMNINRKGKTILMQVAAKNQVDVIRYLHRDSPEENDNKNATDECGRTAVHFAAMKGHPEAIVYLVNNLKCVFDTKDKYGLTLFLLAVREGNEDVVKKLADYGADVNLRNNQGENAVHMATQMRFFDMVKLLERKDCCLDQEDKTGKTPLMIACSNNDSSTVDFLLSRNVLLEPCTKENRQAIHFACEAGGLEVLQKLVEKDISICCTDSAGITTLMLAALAGSREIVKIFLTTVPDLNFVTAKDNYGKTALEYAIIGQNSELLSDLISAGCDVNNRKSNGWTPLLIAIEVGKAAADSMVQILIASGCSKDAETEDGLSAAHLACRCNKLEILKILIEKKFPIDTVTKSGDSCLTLAAAKASAELVGLLIDFGLEKSHTNNDGDSAVSIACLRGDEDVLSKIWPITDEDSVKVYSQKNTLLHFACKGGSKKIAKSLIDKDESLLHARNGDFETPLHLACSNLKLDIVELLLEYGADPNAIGGNGKTPIFGALSASKGFEICQLLLAKSADVNVVSKDGVTVLAEAFFRGSRSIIDLLLQTGARLSADTLPPNFEVFRTNIRSRKNKNLTELLDLGVPVDRRESQWNLLHLAIETCRSSLINELLSRGASVTVKDAKGYTPLLTAIRFGQIDLAREILRKHPESKDDVNNNKNTLLHVAVSESKLSTLRWLLSEFDFLKDAKNCYEETALHLAARVGNEEMYQLLVEKGWDPQLAVRDGRSMLELAARSGNSRFAVTMHLRNHSDSVCESLFCHLASTGQAAALRSLQRRESCKKQSGQIRDAVIASGSQYLLHWMLIRDNQSTEENKRLLNEANQNGETALTLAVRVGNYHIFRKLEKIGCSLEVKTKRGYTLVHEAVAAGHEQILLHLISDPGVLAKEPDVNGDTPLLQSIVLGRTRLLEVLHGKLGCSLNDRNLLRRNAAHLAAIGGNKEILFYLKQHSSNEEFFDSIDAHGDTPLMLAVLHGNTEAAKFLLENCHVNASHQNETQSTALHWAAYKSNQIEVEALLAEAATVDAKNKDGVTPLMLAVQQRSVQCVQALLEKEASPTLANHNGDCALDFMLLSQDREIRELGERLRAERGQGPNSRLSVGDLSAYLTPESLQVQDHFQARPYLGACADFSSNSPVSARDSSQVRQISGLGVIEPHTPQSQN